MRVLLCGPLPPPLGGTTVLFKSLADGLSARPDLDVRVVGSGGVRGRGLAAPAALLKLGRTIAREVGGADVAALHVSTSALHVLGPLFVRACRRAGTPSIIRKFGGTDFMEYAPGRREAILRTLRVTDLYLAETRALVERAESQGLANARWFPNSRPMPPLHDETSDVASGGSRPCSRFVYLGQIHSRKGIRELISAGERMDEGVTVDVYGTLDYDIDEREFDGLTRVRYCGSVAPENVHEVLSRYDALVLPSYHAGEGYPGVILEAYGAGIPVVATRWRALPELVDDSSGVLVEPRDADALRRAMLDLAGDTQTYARLRAGVILRRNEFADAVWHERFVEFCRELSARR